MRGEPLTTLVVVAHPDDEVLGAGIWLQRHADTPVHIVHITDGSPRDMQNAREQGFSTRRAYALARRKELAAALALIGIPETSCTQFRFPDKEAYLHLPAILQQLGALAMKLQPSVVLSPAYEGGHPDHDAAAFAVATLRKRLNFEHSEFPLYHASASGHMITSAFIPGQRGRITAITLSEAERRLKAEMLACFATQSEILGKFKIEKERFRPALDYDFTRAPHPGELLYESWGWGISGADWRAQAARSAHTGGTTARTQAKKSGEAPLASGVGYGQR